MDWFTLDYVAAMIVTAIVMAIEMNRRAWRVRKIERARDRIAQLERELAVGPAWEWRNRVPTNMAGASVPRGRYYTETIALRRPPTPNYNWPQHLFERQHRQEHT